MKTVSVSAEVEDDILTMIKSDGSKQLVGRLSGYSDSELVNPTIDENGFLITYGPERNVTLKIKFKPTASRIETTTQVKGFGTYEDSTDKDFLSERMESGGDLLGMTNGEKYLYVRDRPLMTREGVTAYRNGVTCSISSATTTYPYVLSETNSTNVSIYSAEHHATWIFPQPIKLAGFVLFSYHNTYLNEIYVEVTDDGVNWYELGNFRPGYNGRLADPDKINFTLDADGNADGIHFLENVVVRGLRVTPRYGNIYLIKFSPFVNVTDFMTVTNHNYKEISIDENIFSLNETNSDISISYADVNSTPTDLGNCKSDARRISFKFNKGQVLNTISAIIFDQLNEFAPGKSALFEYSNFRGRITLEPGDYLIDLNLEIVFSNDFRKSNEDEPAYWLMSIPTALAIEDVSSGELLTDVRYTYSRSSSQLTNFVDKITSPGQNSNTITNMLLTHSKTTSYTTLNYRGTMDLQYDLKEELALTGFVTRNPLRYNGFTHIEVHGINSTGEEEMLYPKTARNTATNAIEKVTFENEKKYLSYKVKFYTPNSNNGILHCLPLFLDENEEPVRLSKTFELSLKEATTIAVRPIINSSATADRGTLDIYKLNYGAFDTFTMIKDFQLPIAKYEELTEQFTGEVRKYNTYINMNEEDLAESTGFSRFLLNHEYPLYIELFKDTVIWREPDVNNRIYNMRNIDMYKLEDGEFVDKSDDIFIEGYSPIPGLSLYDGISQYSKVDTAPTVTTNDSNKNINYLVSPESSTYRWFSKSQDAKVTFLIVYDEPIEVNGFYEQSPDKTFEHLGKMSDNVSVSYYDVEKGFVDVGKISKDEVSLDGSRRTWKESITNSDGEIILAADISEEDRIWDEKLRFYPLDSTVTSDRFLFTLEGFQGNPLAVSKLGVFLADDYSKTSQVLNFNDLTNLAGEQVGKIMPMTNILTPGIYKFDAAQGMNYRVEKRWFLEQVLNED